GLRAGALPGRRRGRGVPAARADRPESTGSLAHRRDRGGTGSGRRDPRGSRGDRRMSESASLPERARTLVRLARVGMLSTVSRRHGGHPFGSLMPYALDERSAPLFLVSALAVHTQNLDADPRASLLVTASQGSDNPLAGERVTLMGRAAPVPEERRPDARAAYLDRHPEAAHWVDFGDFG